MVFFLHPLVVVISKLAALQRTVAIFGIRIRLRVVRPTTIAVAIELPITKYPRSMPMFSVITVSLEIVS